jgi:hypothetical protein
VSDWRYDGLWAKTRVYTQRASHEDTDGPLFPLWSTLSLEFLARSSLAYIHPALLADPREGENVLHAFGYQIASTPRSIPALTVFRRCKRVISGFTESDFKACMSLIEMRNTELHSGTAAFEGYPTRLWLSNYFRACQILLAAQGKTLIELFGIEEAAGAEKMIAAAEEKVVGDVKKVIAEATRFFSELDQETQSARRKLAELESKTPFVFEAQQVTCPACNSKALMRGERVTIKEAKIDEDSGTMYRQRVILPNSLRCSACDLNLKGHAAVDAAGLGGNYSILEHVDPAEYFGIETPDLDEYFEKRIQQMADEGDYSNE